MAGVLACSQILSEQFNEILLLCMPATGPDGASGYWEPCAPSAPGAQERDLTWFATNNLADKVLVPSITRADFEASLHRARPTVSPDDLASYEKFTSEFGEEGV
jgi:SpoVK/Ycf46/Vps4 family AAA+-type ATPase